MQSQPPGPLELRVSKGPGCGEGSETQKATGTAGGGGKSVSQGGGTCPAGGASAVRWALTPWGLPPLHPEVGWA